MKNSLDKIPLLIVQFKIVIFFAAFNLWILIAFVFYAHLVLPNV